jgi:hypothetical protein
MTVERVRPTGAIVVSALVYWQGVRWLESATYYGYTVRDAKRSYKESCARLGYEIERG